MDFIEITEERTPFAGEYIYHVPTQGIVLCGKYDADARSIQAYVSGRVFRDKIENFKKIKSSQSHSQLPSRSCGGCKG